MIAAVSPLLWCHIFLAFPPPCISLRLCSMTWKSIASQFQNPTTTSHVLRDKGFGEILEGGFLFSATVLCVSLEFLSWGAAFGRNTYNLTRAFVCSIRAVAIFQRRACCSSDLQIPTDSFCIILYSYSTKLDAFITTYLATFMRRFVALSCSNPPIILSWRDISLFFRLLILTFESELYPCSGSLRYTSLLLSGASLGVETLSSWDMIKGCILDRYHIKSRNVHKTQIFGQVWDITTLEQVLHIFCVTNSLSYKYLQGCCNIRDGWRYLVNQLDVGAQQNIYVFDFVIWTYESENSNLEQ